MIRVAVISCKPDPDYVRGFMLRRALDLLPDVRRIDIKNSNTNVLRFIEVAYKIIRSRFINRPDLYLLTFRGQEFLWLTLLIAGSRPVIFDEFIVPLAWTREKGREESLVNNIKKLLAKSSASLYLGWLKKCRIIMTDTDQHALLSSRLSKIPLNHYRVIPVGADEEVFRPVVNKNHEGVFQVFYYGNMLPLHGLKYVLDAATSLGQNKNIKFVIAGGGKAALKQINFAIKNGANIEYLDWIEFSKLPDYIHASSVCLAGPFGDSDQAHSVITGKTFQFMASSVPVIVGRNEASSIFADKENALLVGLADASDIKEAILWSYNNQSKLDKIGSNGYELFRAHFSTRVISEKLKTILEEVV